MLSRLITGALALAVGVLACWSGSAVVAERKSRRLADEQVGSWDLRTSSGLLPGATLLFNGWGVTPAGEHVATPDMPLKMLLSPDGNTLAAGKGGLHHTRPILHRTGARAGRP